MYVYIYIGLINMHVCITFKVYMHVIALQGMIS